jgi:hypothetical protein
MPSSKVTQSPNITKHPNTFFHPHPPHPAYSYVVADTVVLEPIHSPTDPVASILLMEPNPDAGGAQLECIPSAKWFGTELGLSGTRQDMIPRCKIFNFTKPFH